MADDEWILWDDEGVVVHEGRQMEDLSRVEAINYLKILRKEGRRDVYAEHSVTGDLIEEVPKE